MIRNKMAGRPQSGGLGLDVFNRAELRDIHLATLEVLWQTGIYVQDDEALDIFENAGAAVNR